MPPRNDHFQPNWTPFGGGDNWRYSNNSAKGAISWMNPTQARFIGVPHDGALQDIRRFALPDDCEGSYNTRAARQGRYTFIAAPTTEESGQSSPPQTRTSPRVILRKMMRMLSTFPSKNISWWTAIVFIVGSALFVVSSFMSVLPLYRTDVKQTHPEMAIEQGGWVAFVGSTVFVGGSVLTLLEAVDRQRVFCLESSHTGGETHKRRWLPKWTALKEHYVHELGFVACTIQAISSLFFYWSNFCNIPRIYKAISSNTPLSAGVYRFPKVVGCTGFIVSGLLLMLETQAAWNDWAFDTIGWWIALLKVIGGLLFLTGAGCGYDRGDGPQKASAMLTLIGSFVFLIGSLLLCFEVVQPYPVLVRRVDEQNEHREEAHNGPADADRISLQDRNANGVQHDDTDRIDSGSNDSIASSSSKDVDGSERDSIATIGPRNIEAQSGQTQS